jgi:hypothetical protein
MDTTWNELEFTMLQALICYLRLILASLFSCSMSLVEVYVFISNRPLSDHVEKDIVIGLKIVTCPAFLPSFYQNLTSG